jgi:hypothetical protein
MGNQPINPWWCNDEFLTRLGQASVNFILPLVVILILGVLLFTGRDGEVKGMFAVAVGWLFKGGYNQFQKK